MRGSLSRGVWDQLDGLLVSGLTGQLSDEELLSRFVTWRDESAEAAFAALVERYGPLVLDVCRRVLDNRHDAEDAFQATFLVLARKARSIARPAQLANWLFGVARRTALDARARAKSRRRRERRAQRIRRPETRTAGVEEYDRDELRAILDGELARLPERYRGALVLCELDGLTRRAAAERLGIPEGTLSSRLVRAKDLLRHRLVRRGLAPTALVLPAALAREAAARSAVVPHSLVESAIRAATHVRAGAAVAEASSTSVATLAHGVLNAMLFARIKGIFLALATTGIISMSVGVVAQGPSRPGTLGIHQSPSGTVAVAQTPGTRKRLKLSGSTALDPARLARIRARFAPALVLELARVWDFPKSSGRPEHRELRPGDSVKKGDLLAIVYCTDVASKKRTLLDALVQLELDQEIMDKINAKVQAVPEVQRRTQERNVQGDRAEVNRALNNLKGWDIPQDEIDALRAEAKRLAADKDTWVQTPEGRWIKAEKRAAGVKVDLHEDAEKRWGLVTIRSPIDGVVVERNINNGEMIVDSTANLIQIADLSRLLVTANCPESDLPKLAALKGADRRCTVTTAGVAATTASGTIDEIGYMIDPSQHTAVIKGSIENPGQRIRGGQWVTVTVDVPPPDDVVEIPADAVVDDNGQSIVLVQSDSAKQEFTKRRVQVLKRFDHTVFVRKTSIPEEEQPTAKEAKEGFLPKEPLQVGERVLLSEATESVVHRLGIVERKLDQVLEAVRSLGRAESKKPSLPGSYSPR
jgi:cobalt-zinc-cadmium efflux system membrane fusion protein